VSTGPDNDATARAPAAKDAHFLGDIATLPVFYRLAGRRVVVAGGSRAAVWKAELLAATGAQVDVFAALPDASLQALAAVRGNLRIVEKPWQASDFENAVLVIGETGDAAEAHAMQRAALAAGAHLNIIDKPQWSSFQFGAMVERSPLIVAISTDGGAPVFGPSSSHPHRNAPPGRPAPLGARSKGLAIENYRTQAGYRRAQNDLGAFRPPCAGRTGSLARRQRPR
jgi:hypothetical protein